jgi:hypothetical protein
MDSARLTEMLERLGEAALDPTIWPKIIEILSGAVRAAGGVLL